MIRVPKGRKPPREGEEQTVVYTAALDYLARGWSVIPFEARGKRPLVAWQEFQTRRPTAFEVKDWLSRFRNANIGLVTGAVSGLAVVDVDPQHGGSESLADLERRFGQLPATVEAATGGGGRHLYFEHPGGVVHNRVGLAPGIDLRGDGGCVVAPPSVHPNGNPYTWAARRSPDEVRLFPIPYWLLQLVAPSGTRAAQPLEHWRALVRDGVSEGERNNTLASLTGHLLWHGVDPQVALELLLAWNSVHCRPPLADDEVARTVDSVTRLHTKHHEKGMTT